MKLQQRRTRKVSNCPRQLAAVATDPTSLHGGSYLRWRKEYRGLIESMIEGRKEAISYRVKCIKGKQREFDDALSAMQHDFDSYKKAAENEPLLWVWREDGAPSQLREPLRTV